MTSMYFLNAQIKTEIQIKIHQAANDENRALLFFHSFPFPVALLVHLKYKYGYIMYTCTQNTEQIQIEILPHIEPCTFSKSSFLVRKQFFVVFSRPTVAQDAVKMISLLANDQCVNQTGYLSLASLISTRVRVKFHI